MPSTRSNRQHRHRKRATDQTRCEKKGALLADETDRNILRVRDENIDGSCENASGILMNF